MGKEQIKRTAIKTAFWMSILTLISKGFGFVREMAMATFFGTSYVVDAYVMSQAVPGILFAAFFSAIATAYMPLLSEKVEKEGENAGWIFTSQIIRILLVFSVVAAILGIIFSDSLVSVIASGFTGETAQLTSFFLKVTFSYIIFSSIVGIYEYYLQYKGTFIPQIIVGYVQNGILISVIIISALTSYYFLAFGMLIAYSVRLLIVSLLAKSRGFKYVRTGEELKATIKKIAILGLPVFIGSGVRQINLFVDRFLASGLVEGSIAALNYSAILNGLIMSLSITVLTTLIYPRLNKASARNEMGEFTDLLQRGMVLIIMLAMPFSLGAMVFNADLVQIVFERGKFDEAATSLTAISYLYYSAGLVFMSINDLMLRAYYSLHDMKGPMIFAAIGVTVNITFNLILIGPMAHGGLALATSIAALVNTVLLVSNFRKKGLAGPVFKDKNKYGKIILSSFAAVGLSKAFHRGLIALIWMPRMIYLGLAVLFAAVIYWALLRFFKVKELDLIKELFKK